MTASSPRLIGRYALHGKLAAGGMATIHLGCTQGAVGFSRAVVIKRLHKEYAGDRELVAMLVDEARHASRIRHPNVIPMLDVVAEAGELFLIMEYVHGQSLASLIFSTAKSGAPTAPAIISAVGIGMLEGLHAAHEATSDDGMPLQLIHRDVSPQNIMVGLDGNARVLDFGVAKAQLGFHETPEGEVKGKLAYMSPEQITGEPLDRRTDLWSAGVVLWEMTTRRRLFVADGSGSYLARILEEPIPSPSLHGEVPAALERVLLKALARDPAERFATAREFAVALEAAVEPSSARLVGEWVEKLAGEALAKRARMVRAVEGTTTDPNSVRRQIAVLELENAETVVTPQHLQQPLAEAPVVMRTLRMQPPDQLPLPVAAAPAPPALSAGPKAYVLVLLGLLGGLVLGGAALAWTSSKARPGAALLVPAAPDASASTTAPSSPPALAPAPAPTPPSSVVSASSPEVGLPAPRASQAPPRSTKRTTPTAPAPAPAPVAPGSLDLGTRR